MARLLHLTTTDISLELLLGPQLEAFASAGYEVHAASAPGPFVDAIESRGITFHPLTHSTRSMALVSDIRAAREVYQLFRELRPHIVHTHNPKPGVYGRITARLARVPTVVNTVHGLYAQPSDPLAKRTVVYGLERLAATFSHAELVQNPEDQALLRRLRVPSDRLQLLGNGIDLTRFRPGDDDLRAHLRASLGVTEDTVLIGAVGRLVSEKGYPDLFQAVRGLDSTNTRLVVIGPHEPDKADAVPADMVAAAEEEGVMFLGHRDDIHELYAAMDIYVLATHREGFPRSAMEAAATGLPLVVTDIRGCRQVVDHDINGLLVPAHDADALGGALRRLVSNASLRGSMGAAGLAKARRDFDQQNVIDITLATYKRLLEKPRNSQT